jgi:hypothetical protein
MSPGVCGDPESGPEEAEKRRSSGESIGDLSLGVDPADGNGDKLGVGSSDAARGSGKSPFTFPVACVAWLEMDSAWREDECE